MAEIGASKNGKHGHRTTTETRDISVNVGKIGAAGEAKDGGTPMIGIIINTKTIITNIQTRDMVTQVMDGTKTTTGDFKGKVTIEDRSDRQPGGTATKTMDRSVIMIIKWVTTLSGQTEPWHNEIGMLTSSNTLQKTYKGPR